MILKTHKIKHETQVFNSLSNVSVLISSHGFLEAGAEQSEKE